MKIIKFRITDWFGFNTPELEKFIDDLLKEGKELEIGSQGVNYSFDIWDLAIMYYITTTEEFIKDHGLQEIYSNENIWVIDEEKDVNEEEYSFFPEYDLNKLSKESGNGKYIMGVENYDE